MVHNFETSTNAFSQNWMNVCGERQVKLNVTPSLEIQILVS